MNRRQRALIGAVALATLFVLLPAPQAAGGTFPGAQGFIAFAREGDDGQEEIWIIRPDGSGETKLVDNAGTPSWSPDGRKIAFYRQGAIYIRSASGKKGRLVWEMARGEWSRGARPFYPDWSPTGEHVVFSEWITKDDPANGVLDIVNSQPTNSGIRLVNLRTGRSRLIFKIDGRIFDPNFSPDGTQVAFLAHRNVAPRVRVSFGWSQELWVVNRNGSNAQRLLSFGRAPAWTATGRIVFERAGGLYSMRSDGSDIRHLREPPDFDGGGYEDVIYRIQPSPDGTSMAITTTEDYVVDALDPFNLLTPYNLWVWNLLTGRTERLLSDVAPWVEWQPGCTHLGTRGADVLIGTPSRDLICGLGGNDVIDGRGGDDVIFGHSGSDRIQGGSGRDTIVGGVNSDTCTSEKQDFSNSC